MNRVFFDVIDFLNNISNFGIFLIAILTFGLTFLNSHRNRAAIEITQTPEGLAALIKPDFKNPRDPDVYWKSDYRLIIDVIITNKSAKPISIIEFVLNGYCKFNSYHLTGDHYDVTLNTGTSVLNGIVAKGPSESIHFPVKNQWLKPIIDIPPHTSVRGHLFFHFADKEKVKKEHNKLKIITSRKTFVKYLNINEFHESVLSLPEKILQARDQHLR